MPELKICGLTREEDARMAATLDVQYVGVVLAGAGGPRQVSLDQARRVFDAATGRGGSPRRVGVFGPVEPPEVVDAVRTLRLDVVQLHGDPDADTVRRVRQAVSASVWAVCRLEGTLPDRAGELAVVADAVLLDRYARSALGGTGETLPWHSLRDAVAALRQRVRIVLAGGLRPENVTKAVEALAPDIVDVSSGVESRPGVKDAVRMTAFVTAARGARA